MAFFIVFHVLIHHNKMALPSGNIVILWKWDLLFLPNPVYLNNFGLMHFSLLFSLLIVYLPRFLIIYPHLNVFSTFLLTSLIFGLLDVNAFHIFVLTQLTNYLIVASHVFSSVIVLITKVFGVLIHLLGVFIYPEM